MDGLKLSLSTKFTKSIVTKLLSRLIYRKLGCDVDIQLNDVEINQVDGKIHLHVDVDADISKEDFLQIIESIKLN